ncbi:hypothetical protein IV37_GL000173 [Fructilactobacillus fructivorans]|uniref:DUF2829 domain-containing protein n=1 Tax=Fructilactobacillus fructivorans TaxID=1614 RepID=UPI000705332C|nr:DUF2829 domain-containing protein [Fructilactobacillus fructivorans]KRN13451.1 hypothetical protein IV37_GL000173 [Fructilactobacillus fructivorans]
MDFGDALKLMKQGSYVARKGWNGKNMYIGITYPDIDNRATKPYISMKTADNEIIPWLASQTDVLADDWFEVPYRNDMLLLSAQTY